MHSFLLKSFFKHFVSLPISPICNGHTLLVSEDFIFHNNYGKRFFVGFLLLLVLWIHRDSQNNSKVLLQLLILINNVISHVRFFKRLSFFLDLFLSSSGTKKTLKTIPQVGKQFCHSFIKDKLLWLNVVPIKEYWLYRVFLKMFSIFFVWKYNCMIAI